MVETIRYGIIGTGMMGVEHIHNLQILPGAEIVAVADPDATSLGWARKAIGHEVAEFADAAALVKGADVDAVVVVSPNFTHRAVLEPLFDADVAILCEKPLCTTMADARWVAAKARAHHRPFWTGMEYRFMPPAAEFIAQVHGGRVGALQMLSIREHRFPFLVKVGDWNRFARNTGGTMVEKCCHFFDLMRLIVRSEPVRVYCSGAMDVNHLDERYDGQRPDIIDNSFTTIDFANGVRAMLDLCMFAEGAEHQEEISATGDRARLDVLIPPGDLVYAPR
ncbi:MAG TPA: Gfo/Idh/MocA family oxidoreductase, partial [Novosphingobium sp.]|nr:Gfo/Idh/MocA family oxidoreductase [Novosphingobium sp.]